MKKNRPRISHREQARRASQRHASKHASNGPKHKTVYEVQQTYRPPHPSALLFDKQQTSIALNCSPATVDRLAALGVLIKRKLYPSPNAKVFFEKTNVLNVAQGRAALADEARS
jgi:hypothetical protein